MVRGLWVFGKLAHSLCDPQYMRSAFSATPEKEALGLESMLEATGWKKIESSCTAQDPFYTGQFSRSCPISPDGVNAQNGPLSVNWLKVSTSISSIILSP